MVFNYDKSNFIMFPKEFETERLLMRQWQEQDVDSYAALCADAQVMKYLTGGKTFDRLESWRHLAFLIGHWQLKGFGHWAIEEKQSGKLLGRVGFLQPDGWPGFEIGWTLDSSCWGKGFATEAAKGAADIAFKQMGKSEVLSIIHPQNEASKNVAKRLGESYQYNAQLNGVTLEIWGVDKATYLAHR